MNPLHLTHLIKARAAILGRFRTLNATPNSTVNIHMFTNERVEYINGYFQAALQQLIDDGCVEMRGDGRFLRLLPIGYEEAHTA